MYGKNSMFEHEIIYTSFSGEIIIKKFSDHTNIVFKSEMVASKYISVYVRGPTGISSIKPVTTRLMQEGQSVSSSFNT
jgi:hypothetical protein